MQQKEQRIFLTENEVNSEFVYKIQDGRPHILDAIANKKIQLVVNTPSGKESQHDDSYIRKGAIKHKIPYITTTAAALAAAKGIQARKQGDVGVKSIQEYHQEIN